MQQKYPTADFLRQLMVRRADRYAKLTKTARSALSKAVTNDPAFLSRVEAGGNITLDSYQRTMDWLDRNWPRKARSDRAA